MGHSFVNGPPLLNQIVVMNAARAPTDDIEVRKLIMHSVDKARIVASELYGQAQVADSLFPKDAPYCDIDLTPRWDYDLQKAQLMNCQPPPKEIVREIKVPAPAPPAKEVVRVVKEKEDNLPLILGLTLGIGIPVLLVSGAACFFVGKKRGYADLEKDQTKQRQQEKTPPDTVGAAI